MAAEIGANTGRSGLAKDQLSWYAKGVSLLAIGALAIYSFRDRIVSVFTGTENSGAGPRHGEVFSADIPEGSGVGETRTKVPPTEIPAPKGAVYRFKLDGLNQNNALNISRAISPDIIAAQYIKDGSIEQVLFNFKPDSAKISRPGLFFPLQDKGYYGVFICNGGFVQVSTETFCWGEIKGFDRGNPKELDHTPIKLSLTPKLDSNGGYIGPEIKLTNQKGQLICAPAQASVENINKLTGLKVTPTPEIKPTETKTPVPSPTLEAWKQPNYVVDPQKAWEAAGRPELKLPYFNFTGEYFRKKVQLIMLDGAVPAGWEVVDGQIWLKSVVHSNGKLSTIRTPLYSILNQYSESSSTPVSLERDAVLEMWAEGVPLRLNILYNAKGAPTYDECRTIAETSLERRGINDEKTKKKICESIVKTMEAAKKTSALSINNAKSSGNWDGLELSLQDIFQLSD